MQRSYTMLMTRSSRRTDGHGVTSYRLLGCGCSWMKCPPCSSCSPATSPQRRAIGPAVRSCSCMALGLVCQLRWLAGPKGVHTGAMTATSTHTVAKYFRTRD
eukprot:7760980-Alexandrium_andersonii.AAC.1